MHYKEIFALSTKKCYPKRNNFMFININKSEIRFLIIALKSMPFNAISKNKGSLSKSPRDGQYSQIITGWPDKKKSNYVNVHW
jgi:hypothetical protein